MTFEDRGRFTLAGKRKKRPGPKPRERANVRHRTRDVHKYWNPLHVTMRAVRGLPSFRLQTLYVAFERAVRRTRREDFRVVEYSIQDDHLHLIVEADDKDALARGMKSFSVRANRLFNAAHGRGRGRVWGDRYDRRDLTSAKQVRNAIVYCLQNSCGTTSQVGIFSSRASSPARTPLVRHAEWWVEQQDRRLITLVSEGRAGPASQSVIRPEQPLT